MNILRRFRKPRLGLLLCIVYGALGLSSCYQVSAERVDDEQASAERVYDEQASAERVDDEHASAERVDEKRVVTGRSPVANFGNYLTFAIDPTVHVAAVQADNTAGTTDADPRMSEGVMNRLSDKLMRRGYNRVLTQEDPDLGLTITAIGILQAGALNESDWNRHYSSYWGFPGWSYYYPHDVHYDYETGSLIIDMVDLRNVPRSKPVRTPEPDDDHSPSALAVVWTMIGYKAYLGENGTSRVSNATQAIDQAFAQSPYLMRH